MVPKITSVRHAALGLAATLVVALSTATPAVAQCPNNCTGHGMCIPSPNARRLLCECYEGWTGNACSQRESAKAKAKAKAQAEEEGMIVDLPQEEPARGSKQRGQPATGVRPFDEVASEAWKGLQSREQTLLKNLGWERDIWNTKRSPRTIWPPAMRQPFNTLKPKEQSAVWGLGLTEHDWNAGKVLAILMQNSV